MLTPSGSSLLDRVRPLARRDRRLARVWASIRAVRQERSIERELASYRSQARKAGIVDPGPVEIARRLRQRLADRGVRPIPKEKLHVVFATRLSSWEPHNIPPAIQGFGRMTPFYLTAQGFDDCAPDWPHHRARLDRTMVEFLTALHHQQPVDVLFAYLSGWHITPEAIRAINALGIVTCNMSLDDRLSFVGDIRGGRPTGTIRLASAFDVNLTNASDSVLKYLVEGGLALFWPAGANPDHFRPLERPFEYDVSFVGACYGRRPEYVEYLREHGCQVVAFGPGWPLGPIAPSSIGEVYARSRINLGFSGIGYSMRQTCLKGRDFEVPMSGAVYLTTEQPDLHDVYDVGRDVFTYSTKADCLKKIRFLLGHPEVCAEARLRARERGLRSHTWEARFRQLFQVIGLHSVNAWR